MTDERSPVAYLLGAFVAAVGLGTVASAVAALLAVEASAHVPVFCAGFGAPLVFAALWFFRYIGKRADTADQVAVIDAEARLEKSRPAPVVPVTVPYTRDGETGTLTLRTEERTAKWAAWQAAMEHLMAWIDANQGRITSTALVGREKAFTRVQHWQAAVDQLAAQGWAVPREPGDTTRLTVTRGKLRALILSGRVEWDTATEAPPTLPCPTAAASRVVIEVEKVNS